MALVNGRVVAEGGLASSLRFDRRVLDLDAPPARGDVVVDLAGATVLPGLLNAHDHLELNHYGHLKVRHRYGNAAEWIDDLRPLLASDPAIRRNRAHPLADRLFIGGLKNLLAGVTTVAHHNPWYPEIRRACPVRVLERFGWAHSFLLQQERVGARGERGGDVQARFRATRRSMPFLVHVGEGVDAAAACEVGRLDAIGCLAANTVLVHGVALTTGDWARLLERGSSLVWCPASNEFLFGRTAPVRRLLDAAPPSARPVCLGTDSRLTGARDLLDELRVAASHAVTPDELLHMVTAAPSRVLRLPELGHIAVGSPADLLVLPPADDPAQALLLARRSDVRLVTIGGRPLVGGPELADVFRARATAVRPLAVDAVARIAASGLVRAIARCPIAEPGVDVLDV